MHGRAVVREAGFKAQIEELQAKLRRRERQLFGRTSERSKGKNEGQRGDTAPRGRGPAGGARGHGGGRRGAGPPKLIPKGSLGVSVWALILIDKFLFQRPTYRLLADLRWTRGLELAQGTGTDGLQRLKA